MCPGPTAWRRRISSNQREAEATLHASGSPQTDTRVRSHCCSATCGRCLGGGDSHHQRGSERQNTVGLCFGGKAVSLAKGRLQEPNFPGGFPWARWLCLMPAFCAGCTCSVVAFPQVTLSWVYDLVLGNRLPPFQLVPHRTVSLPCISASLSPHFIASSFSSAI